MSTPITSRNWEDKLCVLVHADGSLASIGEEVVDFRGDGGNILVGGRSPHKPESQGKVYVRCKNGDHFGEQQYYASVFDLKWQPAV
jgi:hypothetical protein